MKSPGYFSSIEPITIGELIEFLQEFENKNKTVWIGTKDGYMSEAVFLSALDPIDSDSDYQTGADVIICPRRNNETD